MPSTCGKQQCSDTKCNKGDPDAGTIAKDEWAIRKILASDNSNLQRVLIFYMFAFLLSFAFVHYIVCIKVWSAIVISLIISQVYLNAICSPIRIDMWSEFDSYVGIYGLIQVGTPIVVFVYAIAAALRDTGKTQRPPRARAVVLEPPLVD